MRRTVTVVLCGFMTAGAQLVVEDVIETDSVDVFSAPEIAAKSPLLTMASSLLFPGLGHHYLEKPKRAFPYTVIEGMAIAGAFLTWRYAERIERGAQTYAFLHAGVEGGEGTDLNYWRNVGRFLESDGNGQTRSRGYNHAMELNRSPGDKYEEPGLQWRWVDEPYQDEYNALMRSSLKFKRISSFFIGAMVLNRALAIIDSRSLVRHAAYRTSSRTPSVTPLLVWTPRSCGITFSSTF